MNEKLLSSISVMFLLIMNVVSAFELPNDGVYEMEQATFFEKVFCQLGFKECFNTNEGLMVMKEKEKQVLNQQAILSAGLRNVDTESSYFNPYATIRDFKEGTKVGFCAMVKFEDPDNKCVATGFFGGAGSFNINGRDYSAPFIFNKKVGDVDRYCYVLTAKSADSPYVYSKVGFIASCGSSAYQGSKTFTYTANVIKAGQSCQAGWECSGDSIRYVNGDCSKQDLRTCDGGQVCGGGYPDAKCVPKPQEQSREVSSQEPQVPPSEGASVNGVCELGEGCDNADCVTTELCATPVGLGKSVSVNDPKLVKAEQKGFFQNYKESIILSSTTFLILIVIVIVIRRRR